MSFLYFDSLLTVLFKLVVLVAEPKAVVLVCGASLMCSGVCLLACEDLTAPRPASLFLRPKTNAFSSASDQLTVRTIAANCSQRCKEQA